MHPSQKEDARHIAGLAMRVALFTCGALLIVLPFSSTLISSLAHNPELGKWLWTLPFVLLSIALFNVVNYWFSRKKEYKVAATSKLLYSSAGEPLKLAGGYFGMGVSGLIVGTVIGNIAAAFYSWRQYKLSEPLGFNLLSKDRIKELANEHSNYPRFALSGAVLNNLAQWAHVVVFIFFYGEKALIPIGLIALSRRIFFNPLGILSTSYGQVFYQRISEIQDPYELKKFYLKNLGRFLAFASALVIIVQLLPSNTLGFIFGEEWTEALVYLKILSYWYALNFVIGTLSFILYRLQLQLYTLLVDIFHFLIVIAAFWFAYSTGMDEIAAVKAMVWAKVIYLVINGLAVIYFLDRNCRTIKNKNH